MTRHTGRPVVLWIAHDGACALAGARLDHPDTGAAIVLGTAIGSGLRGVGGARYTCRTRHTRYITRELDNTKAGVSVCRRVPSGPCRSPLGGIPDLRKCHRPG